MFLNFHCICQIQWSSKYCSFLLLHVTRLNTERTRAEWTELRVMFTTLTKQATSLPPVSCRNRISAHTQMGPCCTFLAHWPRHAAGNLIVA
jgi:hypothetical protein